MKLFKTVGGTVQFTAGRLPVYLLLILGTLGSGSKAQGITFKQETGCFYPDGSSYSQTVIDPDAMDLTVHNYHLGLGRILQIQTNLPDSRFREIDAMADVVKRCYAYLEGETERTIPGGVLLYLLQYPQRPRHYFFEVEMDDDAGWAQVRVALLAEDQALLGFGASSHVTDFLYDTLPHELTHNLLTTCPTVRHDTDGGSILGTRWFIEGVCETLAKGFSAGENPHFHRLALEKRHPAAIVSKPQLGTMVWDWGQSSKNTWSDESDLYGLSMLLVTAWSERINLSDLLFEMTRRGGMLDGDGLARLLETTTGMGKGQLLEQAKSLAWKSSVSGPLSARQGP